MQPTANGKVATLDTHDLLTKELGHLVEWHFFSEGTPAFLTIGLLCMGMGFTLERSLAEGHYFITHSGQIIVLEVEDNVPSELTGSYLYERKRSERTRYTLCIAPYKE